eukprot:scaffold2201_cov110-Isochrysis_galbana.AAC.8
MALLAFFLGDLVRFTTRAQRQAAPCIHLQESWDAPPTGRQPPAASGPDPLARVRRSSLTMRPPSPRCTTRSAMPSDDTRCVMRSTVLPCSAVLTDVSSAPSVCASSADVNSSSTIMGASRSSMRAMATRCRCPPDMAAPCSPTSRDHEPGSEAKSQPAFAAARCTSSSGASGRPSATL